MAAPTPTPTPTPTDRAVHRRRDEIGGIVFLVVGVLLVVLAVGWNDVQQARLDRLARTGVRGSAVVSAVVDEGAPSGHVCILYTGLPDGGAACVRVEDPGSFRELQTVDIRYDARHPADVSVVGHDPNRYFLLWFIGGGLVLALWGTLWLADAQARRRNGGGERHGWLSLMALGGLTTWAGFGFVGLAGHRKRWLGWAAVYAVGMSAAVALERTTPRRLPVEALALGCWLAVWVGGVVHALAVVPEVDRRRGRATERPRTRPLPPPPAGVGTAGPTPPGRLETAVEFRLALPGHDRPPTGTGPPTIHAVRRGEPLCTAAAHPLVPTSRRWPGTGGNTARRCPICSALADPRLPEAPGDQVAVGTQTSDPPAWTWHNWSNFVLWVMLYLTCVLIWQGLLIGASFNPDVGGSLNIGLPVLAVNAAVTVWFFARLWRDHTTFGPDAIERVGFGRPRVVPWSDVAHFRSSGSGTTVVTVDGRSLNLGDGFKTKKTDDLPRADVMNGEFGFTASPLPPLPPGHGLVELPTTAGNERGGRPGRSGILHAVTPDGGPKCGRAEGPVLPTLRPWRAQDRGCLELCRRCVELEPCRSDTWLPYFPLFRPPRPRPGREWTHAVTRGGTWGIVLIWAMCGGIAGPIIPIVQFAQGHLVAGSVTTVLLAVPAVVILWRFMKLATTVGAQELTVTGFWKSRTVPWSEIRGFTIAKTGNNNRTLEALTVRNEAVRLHGVPAQEQLLLLLEQVGEHLRREGTAPTWI